MNDTIPFCTDCKHHSRSFQSWDGAVHEVHGCSVLQVAKRDPVTGADTSTASDCVSMRSAAFLFFPEGKCGPDGKLFEPKPVSLSLSPGLGAAIPAPKK